MFSLTKEFDLCIVSGKESVLYCGRLSKDSKYEELYKSRLIHATHPRHSSTNEKVFFYPYSLINQTVVMQEENHPITDPDVKCGLLLYRHNNEENNYQQPGTLKYVHYYNEDVCHFHLKSLHSLTSITGLKEWREKNDYIFGINVGVGGLICRLLQIYGACILFPILLNLIFNIVLFINDFRDQKANIFEIIPLLLLVYPQYKILKFLSQYIFNHRDEQILRQEIEESNRTVAPLEPFLESCFQVRYMIGLS